MSTCRFPHAPGRGTDPPLRRPPSPAGLAAVVLACGLLPGIDCLVGRDAGSVGDACRRFAWTAGLNACAGQEPSDDALQEEDEPFVVVRAKKVITVSGREIHDGTIVIAGGKIRNIGRNLEYPLSSRVIDATDRVVMPGLINVDSRYSLPNYQRTGIHADLNVRDEFHPSDSQFEVALEAGYTMLALTPDGSGIPGRAAVVHTGGTLDKRVIVPQSYLLVGADPEVLRDALSKAEKEIEKVEKARKEFEEKQKKEQEKAAGAKKDDNSPSTQPASGPATQPAFEPPPIAPALQPIVDLIQKKEGAFALIRLDRASDYLHMVDVIGDRTIAHDFIVRNDGNSDFYHVAEAMGAAETKVAMLPYPNTVTYSSQRVNVVRQFDAAGCEVSLFPLNYSAREQANTLARAAELVRDGWSRDAALKALTLHPARLLRLDERFGSIEKGKQADLIFLDADPLDPLARVREVMIGGEIVHRAEVAE